MGEGDVRATLSSALVVCVLVGLSIGAWVRERAQQRRKQSDEQSEQGEQDASEVERWQAVRTLVETGRYSDYFDKKSQRAGVAEQLDELQHGITKRTARGSLTLAYHLMQLDDDEYSAWQASRIIIRHLHTPPSAS